MFGAEEMLNTFGTDVIGYSSSNRMARKVKKKKKTVLHYASPLRRLAHRGRAWSRFPQRILSLLTKGKK